MNKTDKIKLKRKQAAQLLGNVCKICLKQSKKNLHFHHIGYQKDEKKHSDFKSWVDYNEYVLPIIINNPNRFTLLCITCHRLISILQSIKDDSRFERVVTMARRSR